MKPSPLLLLSATLAGLLLGACDPIQIEVILPQPHAPPGPPQSTPDAGSNPAPPTESGCEGGWKTRELATDVSSLAFTFDAEAVGHYAFTRDGRILVGTTREGALTTAAGALRGYVQGLAVDAQGRRHLLFQDAPSTTSYAWEQGGLWQRVEVAPNSYPVALRLDASGFAHAILQLGQTSRQLGYATNRSGQWLVTPLGITARNSRADLTLDSGGHAHIAWHADSSDGIHYGTNASGTWSTERVAELGGNEPVLVVDRFNRVHILYSAGGSLAEHLVREEGSWRGTSVGGATGIAIDLVADKAGNLHALLDRTSNPKLVYATLAAGSRSWTYTPILSLTAPSGVTNPWKNVLGLDAQGGVHVGYWYMVRTDGEGVSGDFLRYAWPCR